MSFFAAAPAAQAPAAALPPGVERIDRAELLRHAGVLAADEMRGRLTGTDGQAKAADYIAGQLAALGLEPLGDAAADGKRGWLQRYPIVRTSLTERAGLTLGKERVRAGYALLPWRGKKAVECRGKLVLCATDLDGADSLAGAVPLVLPKAIGGKGLDASRQFGAALALLQRLSPIAARVERAGGQVLVVGLLDDDAAVASVLNYVGIAPGKPIVRAGEELAELAMDADMGLLLGGKAKVPVVFTSAQLTRALLAHAGIDADAARAWAFDAGERPAQKEAEVEVVVEQAQEEATASNVVGILRGSDPDLAGEAVVFSAHMDHIGQRLDGDAFNGADDNASGSAGLLEIAQAFAQADARPRRSVIFLSVSGEELGLWGSAWFAEHPTFAASGLIANINTDMIGRAGPSAGLGQVMLTPSYRHPMYSSLGRAAAEAAPAIGLELVADDTFYLRSDHFNFIKKGIPAVFLCCAGEHEDYHQVTDHVELLDGEQMEKTARLAFAIGWAIANGERRPEVIGRCKGWLGEPSGRDRKGKGDASEDGGEGVKKD